MGSGPGAAVVMRGSNQCGRSNICGFAFEGSGVTTVEATLGVCEVNLPGLGHSEQSVRNGMSFARIEEMLRCVYATLRASGSQAAEPSAPASLTAPLLSLAITVATIDNSRPRLNPEPRSLMCLGT